MADPLGRLRAARSGLARLTRRLGGRGRFNLHLQHDPSWQRRAEIAVDMWLEPGGSRAGEGGTIRIADLGCGNERLRGVLTERIGQPFSYQGYDLQPQQSTTIRLDLARELPDGEFDVAFALGVVEYIPEPERLLAGLRAHCGALLVSYVVSDSPDRLTEEERGARGWRTHYTRAEFEAVCRRAGWELVSVELIEEGRTGVWLLRHGDD
jgi:SAM-dependent methyltransferase